MHKKRPGLLFLTISVWIAYFICALIFGLGEWFVKVLSVAPVILFGILLFYIWRYMEHKNKST